MGKKEVRAEELLQIIEKRRTVSIKALAALMNVSELTIRRDIRAMDDWRRLSQPYRYPMRRTDVLAAVICIFQCKIYTL